MAKESQKVKIYMNGKYIETCRNEEAAQLRIKTYERQDRYEVEVEGYAIPKNGYPVYTIVK